MDYATIATMAITALWPFVIKGLEKLAEKAAEEGYNERRTIWKKVKGLFNADDLTLLNLLQNAQKDPKAQGKLEGKLETHLEANPEIARELEALLQKIPASAVKQNTLTQIGDANTGFQDVQGSTITVNK